MCIYICIYTTNSGTTLALGGGDDGVRAALGANYGAHGQLPLREDAHDPCVA